MLILFFVGMNTWLTQLRSTDWDESLWVVVYPVNGDNSPVTQKYIGTLSRDTFRSIESFLDDEANRYGMAISDPVTVRLAEQVADRPPLPPINGSTLSVMLWSLKLRYWAFRNDNFDGPKPDVQMFVVYHDPDTHNTLRHSLGIQKGMIGVVNAYAGRSLAQRNNVVIAHEFLHTLGASDKYDRANNQPIYPDGYAEPDRTPLHPQRKAEIMAGRIPLSDHQAVMPKSFAASSIGAKTAHEIRWIN
ncbi:MAG: hypothetical protein WBN08_16885 [Thiogranum sp.]